MEIKDYEKHKQMLNHLEALKEIKGISENYDQNYQTAKIFVDKAWKGELGEEALNYVEDMLDLVETHAKVVELVRRTLLNVSPVSKEVNEQKKNMKASEDTMKESIGKIMKDILHNEGLMEGDIHFPRFGTVRCSLKKENVITNEDELKHSLAKNNMWDMLRLETKTKLKKISDISKLNGIENQEIPTITINSSK